MMMKYTRSKGSIGTDSNNLDEAPQQLEHNHNDTPGQEQDSDKISQGKPRRSALVDLSTSTEQNRISLYKLAKNHHHQFLCDNKVDEIEKAIEYGNHALDLTPEDHPDLPPRLVDLGLFHYDRFGRLGAVEDIEKSIEYHMHALDLTPEDHPSLPSRLASLGSSYYTRFQRIGELGDIEKSIEYETRALDLTPEDHPSLPSRLASLGSSYYTRFQRIGELDDIEKSIEYKTRALDLTPQDHPDLPDQLASLGSSYYTRFQRIGELDDIEKSIEYKTRALNLTPQDHPDLPSRLASLGSSYYTRFQRIGELNDIEKSIEYHMHALDLTPQDHPSLPSRLANLGSSYYTRFQRTGELDDIEKSIEYETRALDLTPEDHPSLPSRLASLGSSYYTRFQRIGELGDIEKSIEYETRALDLTPEDHPRLPDRLASLGSSYYTRFQRIGELGDIEKSIEYYTRALDLTPQDHPDLPDQLASLGSSYHTRFQRIGELDDIEKSIEYKTRALDLTSQDHPDLPDRLASLGLSYYTRFQRIGELDDIEKSIEYYTRALDLTPQDHPSLPSRLASLGSSYYTRFQRIGELADIEKSIEYDTRALDLTPEDHPRLPSRLASLGSSYYTRFQRIGKLNDIEKSIQWYTRALDLTPKDHPVLADRHSQFAYIQFTLFQLTGNHSHLQLSLDSFRKASQTMIGAPRGKFQHALSWATLASKHSSLYPIEAYQTTINLLPQFIWLGATTNQRYEDLLQVGNLAIEAASVAIHSSEHRLAIEWLEHARCVVWSQSLMLRSPLDQLEASYPDLAIRLQVVAKQLHDASSKSAIKDPSFDAVTPEQYAQQRRRLAKEYNDLLEQARTLAGFEDFLRPMKADNFTRAARHGPVVVINCHMDHCDALLVFPGQVNVTHLPLPDFTSDKANHARSEMENALRNKGVRERGVKILNPPRQNSSMASVLELLWKDVVKPILDSLGYIHDSPTHILPHITWCPTGVLSFLPLHAAGDYTQPRSRVFDYVISSYTPTLSALASSPSSLSPNSRVLAIGQAKTPHHSPLPGTIQELKYLSAHTQNKAQYSQLTDKQATTSTVLDAMEHHDWVHLACHAHQNFSDPTKSGFHLYDGTLDLASINRRSFKNKGLAFLSACQTATGDERLPDEAIHLASSMLMAGYSSVIATMWSVRDEDAPFVADKVYAKLMKDGKLGNGEAGNALHYAVAELRDKIGEQKFECWVPYIHIGS